MTTDLAELSESWFCNFIIIPPENKNRFFGIHRCGYKIKNELLHEQNSEE
jgi:hypothetical protein